MELRPAQGSSRETILVSFNRTYVELRPGCKLPHTSSATTFNRTYVELRPQKWYTVGQDIPPSFNRTYVELRLRCLKAKITFSALLIVPMWN